MKIAVKHALFGSCLLAMCLGMHPALAIPPGSTPTMSASGAVVTAPPAPQPVNIPAPSNDTAVTSPQPTLVAEAKTPDLSRPLPSGKKTKSSESESGDKVPESVKDTIKNLTDNHDEVTLDDLNAARKAVAKLDAIIDIEKRLSDLEKIRADREGTSSRALMAALPASAFQPPQQASYSPAPIQAARPVYAPMNSIEVDRIEGSNGRYTAYVKEGDSTRLVRVGDHLPDGSSVVSVTPHGVEFERDKTTHIARVRDVQAVFGE